MPRTSSMQSKVLIALRILTILTAIVGVAGLAWAATKEHAISTDGLGIAFDQLGAIALGISGLWSIIALLIGAFFNDPHPGIFIGLDSPIFALTIAIGVSIATGHVSLVTRLTCQGDYMYCDETEDRTIIFRIIAITFCFVNCLCHATFVGVASKSCHQRRKGISNTDVEFKS